MPWQPPSDNSQVLAVHSAYMGFGKILYFGGDQHDSKLNEKHIYDASCLYDCSSGSVKRIKSPHFDAFCSGHAFINAVNIVKLLVAGGTEKFPDPDPGAVELHHEHFPGLRDATIFSSPDFSTPTVGGWEWTAVKKMNPAVPAPPNADVPPASKELTGGRWYPTLLTLPSGDVIAFSGHPGSGDGTYQIDLGGGNIKVTEHNNFIPEIFSLNQGPQGNWRRLGSYRNADDWAYYSSNAMTNYPRLHILPTGHILCTSLLGERTTSFLPDVGPRGGEFIDVSHTFPGIIEAFTGYDSTSVLLPLSYKDKWRARAMICGGASESAYILDMDGWNPGQPTQKWVATSPRKMKEKRVDACAVILPTGEIFVCGGLDVSIDQLNPQSQNYVGKLDSHGVKLAEIFDPYKNTWDVADSPAKIVRNYHSVALLMPDGRVWTAGSDIDASQGAGPPDGLPDKRNLNIEIFEPWYIAEPGRPFVKKAPSSARPGETIQIVSTFAREITRVVMVRCGSCTHAFNPDQRMVDLEFRYTFDDNILVVMPPNSNILVPGPYLIYTLRTPGDTINKKIKNFGLPSFGTDIYIVPGRR